MVLTIHLSTRAFLRLNQYPTTNITLYGRTHILVPGLVIVSLGAYHINNGRHSQLRTLVSYVLTHQRPLNLPQDQENDLVRVTGHCPEEKGRNGSEGKETVANGRQGSHPWNWPSIFDWESPKGARGVTRVWLFTVSPLRRTYHFYGWGRKMPAVGAVVCALNLLLLLCPAQGLIEGLYCGVENCYDGRL